MKKLSKFDTKTNVFKTKKAKFRMLFIVFMCFFLSFFLVLGIGIVDNCNKSAQNNPFLNGIFIDTDNYILCMRYLGLKFRIPYGIKGVINGTSHFLKPLFISILVFLVKIKEAVLSLFQA